MIEINNSQRIYCNHDVYKTFFFKNKCYVPTHISMKEIYHLDSIAKENDRIILIDPTQEAELEDEGYVHNGLLKCKLDNLKHIYVQKYKLKLDNGSKTATTNLFEIRDENCTYSHFLANLILEHLYINHMSFETISELLKLYYDLDIDYRRVHDIYYKYVDDFKLMKLEDVKQDIINKKIKLGHVANYDEEFCYCKHQPVVRMTLIDFKSKIIIKDIIVPRKIFNRELIKEFIGKSLGDYDYHTVVTDGDKRYKKILTELGLNQQRCIFHSMQNLMSRVNPVHNRLKRKIKKINKQIAEKEKEKFDIEEKYRGVLGKPNKNDAKRIKDIKRKNELKSELSQLRAERSKHRNYIKTNNKYVKKIAKIVKAPTYEKGIERFNELWAIKDDLSDEIRKHLKNLKEYLHEVLWHTLNKDVPRTNNLIESFYKATFPRSIKRVFMTYEGLNHRINLAGLRWTERVISAK